MGAGTADIRLSSRSVLATTSTIPPTYNLERHSYLSTDITSYSSIIASLTMSSVDETLCGAVLHHVKGDVTICV